MPDDEQPAPRKPVGIGDDELATGGPLDIGDDELNAVSPLDISDDELATGGPLDIGDDELAALALAADPDAPIPADAVPFGSTDGLALDLLPSWYMPAPSLRRSPIRTVVFAVVVIALLVINVAGLCVTYGVPDPVWK